MPVMERKTKAQERKRTLSPRWWGYVIAVGGTVVATVVRWALGQIVGEVPLYSVFYPVVFAAAVVGGTRPGLLATVLSVLAVDLFFMEPVGALMLPKLGDAEGLGLFSVINVCISILGGRFRKNSEALREGEARLRMAHQAAHVGAFEWDVQTGVNVWTPELEAMYGLTPGEFGGTEEAWEQLVHPEDRDKAVGLVERAFETLQTAEGEWRVVWPDGSLHWIAGRFQASKDEAGKHLRLTGVNIDVTDQKRAAEELRRSEERFRTMVDAIPQLAWIARPDGYIFWFNRRTNEYIGATSEQLEGWAWQSVVDPQALPMLLERWRRSIATGEPYDIQFPLRGADGRFRPFLTRVMPLKDSEGKVALWFGTHTDITEIQEAQEALRQSERRLRQFIDEAPVAISMLDTEMRYLAVSRRWLQNFNVPGESVLGRNHYEVFPEIPERWKQIHRRCLAGAVERADKDLFERADGRRQWVRWEVRPWYAAPGTIGGLVIFSEEITARVEAVEALRQSEERFRAMADAIPQLVWIARADGYSIWFNRRACEYTGASVEQLEGWAWQSVVDPQVLPRVLERWRQSIVTGEPYDEPEFPLRGADGCFHPFLVRVMPVKDQEGRVALWFGTATDITEQKRAEAEIIALRDRLAADLAGMNRLHALSTRLVSQGEMQALLDAILDAAIEITRADKGHVQLYDAASGELGVMGQRGFDPAFVNYSIQIRPGVLASGRALQTHERVVVEDMTASPLYVSEPRALKLVLAAGMRAVVCTPLLTRAGQLVGTISVLFGAPHQPSERDLHLLDLLARQAADFIERTHAEADLRAAKEELDRVNQDLEEKVRQRTAKLQETVNELEHFSYTITHDMRAPLRAMQNYTHIMLEEECASCLQAVPKDYLGRIQVAARRMDALIVDALQYSRTLRGDFPVGSVDVAAVLRGMLQSYPNLQPPKAQIRLEGDFPLVSGNEAGMTQCFSNLLSNAVKFVERGKTPRVRVWAERRDGFVRVWVEDNGIGIAKEQQGRIWEMFQTLEKRQDGTGIGLALVRKVVDRMGGQTGVESEVGSSRVDLQACKLEYSIVSPK